METAALKAASESRNKVFVRKVTAVYTPATLEAGVFEDSAADAGEDEEPADISPSYLFAVSERQANGEHTGTPNRSLPDFPFQLAAATAHLCAESHTSSTSLRAVVAGAAFAAPAAALVPACPSFTLLCQHALQNPSQRIPLTPRPPAMTSVSLPSVVVPQHWLPSCRGRHIHCGGACFLHDLVGQQRGTRGHQHPREHAHVLPAQGSACLWRHISLRTPDAYGIRDHQRRHRLGGGHCEGPVARCGGPGARPCRAPLLWLASRSLHLYLLLSVLLLVLVGTGSGRTAACGGAFGGVEHAAEPPGTS